MKNLIFIVSFLFVFTGFFVRCSDDDSFSTSASDQPRFSVDTLSFDTLISTVGSSTRWVMMHNSNRKAIRINSIILKSGGSSGFIVNVDGVPGTDFQDVELRKKDSLYVFVEVRLPERGADMPQLVEDELIATTNGVTQRLVLRAFGQDAVMMRGRTLQQDTLIKAGKPWVIYDSLCIAEGVTLNCEAGARLMFHSGAQLKVWGTLNTYGDFQRHVVFRGDRMDKLFSNLPYDRTPGQWEGIRFYPSSMDNYLQGVNIHSANTAIVCDSSDRSDLKLSLVNSIVHTSTYNNLQLTGCRADLINSLIANSGRSTVYLADGDYRLIHCTVLNKYAFAARQGPDVAIVSSAKEGNGVAFTNVGLFNSLFAKNMLANFAIDSQEYGVSMLFNGVAENFNSQSYDDEYYVYLNSTSDYLYDFHPTLKNPCINAGDPTFSFDYPNALDGFPRLSDGYPDNGCYEWREEYESWD